MDIDKNIQELVKRLGELDTEAKRIQGALEVLNTLKSMGVKVVNPEDKNLETVVEEEVIDNEPPATPSAEKSD